MDLESLFLLAKLIDSMKKELNKTFGLKICDDDQLDGVENLVKCRNHYNVLEC